MRIVALRGLDELVHDMLGRHTIRIAHAHVYDIFATTTRFRLEFGGDIENVGGQTIDARKDARRLDFV